jgi:hypothetical protein
LDGAVSNDGERGARGGRQSVLVIVGDRKEEIREGDEGFEGWFLEDLGDDGGVGV